MVRLILRIFDYMRAHHMVGALSFIACTVVLILFCLRVEYKEDISDFLSLDDNHSEELKVFQNISGADKIFTIFQYVDSTIADIDVMIQSIDNFVENVTSKDTTHIIKNMVVQVDLDVVTEATEFIYNNIPYFLTENDYTYIDSVLNRDDYVGEQLLYDKQMLMFPSSELIVENIQRDPLNLFSSVIRSLQSNANGLTYEMYDGYIFSPDMQKAIVVIDSPFGASETENNAQLVDMLKQSASLTEEEYSNIDIHIIGGPMIAVGNATQIKKDGILSITCAMVLILLFLFIGFRNVRNLLLIALSICWGWLFGFGCLSLVHHDISVIVLGISSVVIGIAVNYPLHLIAHLSHTQNKREALSEIVAPLLVGNITTVGAFLALVPLRSVALRDLGLFSSFMLIGTIIFVLLYLPHIAKSRPQTNHTIFYKFANITFENKPYIAGIVLILTLIFGYYSLQTKFDANMANINYMTAEQKADMAYFQNMTSNQNSVSKIYVISSGDNIDEALEKNGDAQSYFQCLKKKGMITDVETCSQYLCSMQEQNKRLNLWSDFIHKYRKQIEISLRTQGNQQGFTPGSFDDFFAILHADYQIKSFDYFHPLTQSVLSPYLTDGKNGKGYNVVDVISVDAENMDIVEDQLKKEGLSAFDAISMNSAIANNLSNDFNYIGWACGCIVFFFLWLSLGSIELAILSFIPMAVSWIWILGLMAMLGIQFNIVNIILATFIFGQGDDYTIFMTEGSCYEYAYRKKILSSYKNSIAISALIMFIGIGSLILAKHPALHSLAEVTIIGMLSVVLMAYILPPLIFKWIVSNRGVIRIRPFSLSPALVMIYCAVTFFSQLFIVYILGFFLFVIQKETEAKRRFFRRFIQRLYTFDFGHIYGVKTNIINDYNEDFARPAMVISNHQSMLDAAIFMMLSTRFVLVSNEHVSKNLIIRQIYKWLGCLTLSSDNIQDMRTLESLVQKGYSIVIFPEGERNPNSSILRFHKGAFYIAEQLKLDIVPIFLHGLNHVLPRNSFCVYNGKLTIKISKRIDANNSDYGCGYVERTRSIHQYYLQAFNELASHIETTAYYKKFVLDRYRYKGYDIFYSVKKKLKKYQCYSKWIDYIDYNHPSTVIVIDNDYGAFALMYALVHPSFRVIAVMENSDNATILRYSAEGVAKNIYITDSMAEVKEWQEKENCMIYLLEPSDEIKEAYVNYDVIEIN